MFLFTFSRFTSLTSTSQGKSASRSLRRWAQATVSQCSKHVSDITRVLLSLLQLDWTSITVMCLLCTFPPTAFCKVGVGICYDMRFAELAQLYSRRGECPVSLCRWTSMVSDGAQDGWSGCVVVFRLSAACLPGSLQHDDWSSPLGAPAEGEVRLKSLKNIILLKNSYQSEPNIF